MVRNTQQSFTALVQLVGEVTANDSLGIVPTSYATVLEMDKKLKLWTTPRERAITYQRQTSASFFLGGLMNLHRPYLMQAPPILPPLRSIPGNSIVQNPSRERCIETAMELVHVLSDANEEAARWGIEPQVPVVLFHYAYFVFDGAVALVGALSQDPPHPKAEECLDLIYRAMQMLAPVAAIRQAHESDSARAGEADTASRALTILAALRKAGRWDERFGKKVHAPPARDLADTATFTSSATPVPEPPVDLYGLGGFQVPARGELSIRSYSV
ncbi:hypothetical protein LXA43DRAFT_1096105 [Ganoderma leucocontextum]|nr:hypothetical protein LXA43DRAFT_1096105 [Ganoderma leucocontextum]